MSFTLPKYTAPDFSAPGLADAPDVRAQRVSSDGILPDNYHSTSMFPEYYKIGGEWILARESRMDCCAVLDQDNKRIDIVEARNVKKGDSVILGRTENGEDGILVYAGGFTSDDGIPSDRFYFRKGRSRETSFAMDYDNLAELLRYEKNNGKIVWVMGPAVAFDSGARDAFRYLEDNGYVDAVMAGNALATHDLEAAYLHTALGQDIYSGKSVPMGHYNHLDVINEVRKCGSIRNFVESKGLNDGIMSGCVRNNIPFVLAGSIRDDGPLPEVIGNAYEASSAMRDILRDATTVICMATMLHTIATGNMTPSFRTDSMGTVRPVYFYAVDADEFVVNKLQDRGSISATTIVANVQDFLARVASKLN